MSTHHTTPEPKTDAFCKLYLDALENQKLPAKVSYNTVLHEADLDYTPASLKRLNKILETIKAETNLHINDYKNNPSHTMFLSLLTFYLGNYVAKLTELDIHWFQGKSYFYDDTHNAGAYQNTFVCELDRKLIKPFYFLVKVIFTNNHEPINLQIFISEAINIVNNNHTAPQAISNYESNNHKLKEKIHQNNNNIETDSVSDDNNHNSKRVSAEATQPYKSYEEKFQINYNSKILASFKLPILQSVVISALLSLLFLYQTYTVFNLYQNTKALPIISLLFALFYLVSIIMVWVFYNMSFIHIFDNKVTLNTPFKNETTRFDKCVRFYHIQGDKNFMGEKDHVVIRSNIEKIKLRAQNHEEMSNLLMEVEVDLLVPTIQARLANSETISFSSIELNTKTLKYGTIETDLDQLGESKVVDSYLFLYKKDGSLFARIGVNSEPNINTFLTTLSTLRL